MKRTSWRGALGVCLGAAIVCAQAQPLVVDGTVRDEHGAPLADARVHLECCLGPFVPTVLAIELDRDPLPSARSNGKGAFSLVLSPVHQRFDWQVHGQFALVVEAPGRQAWRELLPSPLGLWRGSDVVLPLLRAEDRATVRVPSPPPQAIVRLARLTGDDYMQQGGAPAEHVDLPLPSDGVLAVDVPLLPNPACVPNTKWMCSIGWTVQLLAPGRSTAPVAIVAGDTLTLSNATAGKRTRVPNAVRALHRLPGGALHWYAVNDGEVVDDPLLPPCAVEVADGDRRVLCAWGVSTAVTAAMPARLRVAATNGEPIDGARIALHVPDALVFVEPLQQLRPLLPAARTLVTANGVAELPRELGDATALWITATGHRPRLVLDVRALGESGRIELEPYDGGTTVVVGDGKGGVVAGARVYASPYLLDQASGRYLRDAPMQLADGSTPVTDERGRCEVPVRGEQVSVLATADGWHFNRSANKRDDGAWLLEAEEMHRWSVHTVDARGRFAPFANLGFEVWVKTATGSRGTQFTAMADSRGNATLLAPGDQVPRATFAQLGGYVGSGTPLDPRTAIDLRVDADPLVAIRAPRVGPGWPSCVFGWHQIGLPSSGGINVRGAELDSVTVLLRWPAALKFFAFGVADGPPVIVQRDEALAAAGCVIDRRAIARRVPLRVTGDVPTQWAGVGGALKAIAEEELDAWAQVPGDGAVADGGALTLQLRDEHAQAIWLTHPELVPARVAVAAKSRDPIAVTVARGAACTLVLRLPYEAREGTALKLLLWQRGLLGRELVGVAQLRDPRLCTKAATTGIELPCPFALPTGKLTLATMYGELTADVEVADAQPVRVEFKARR